MKNISEQMGKTVEEAIRKGLEELKVPRDDVKIEILEEPSQGGLFGILSSKLAKVRLIVDKKISEVDANKTVNRVTEILNDMFAITKEDIKLTFGQSKELVTVKLEADDVKHLVGYRGRTIESLQSLLNSILQKEDSGYAKIFVEINDYKKQKEQKIASFARRIAENVIKYKKPIKLEPMSAYERMIVHKELSTNNQVITESIGEEPRRRVVIKKKY